MRKLTLRMVVETLSLFVFLFLVLMLRTTGINCDENNYLGFDRTTFTGDSAHIGKPVLFYAFNHFVYTTLGPIFGAFRPYSTYLVFIVLYSISLCFLLYSSPKKDSKSPLGNSVALFALVTAPVVLLNATQHMMESALLPLIVLLFAFFLRPQRRGSLLGAFLVSLIAAAIKSPAALPILAMAAAFFFRRKKVAFASIGGVAGGLLGNSLFVRYVIKPSSYFDYGGMAMLWATFSQKFSVQQLPVLGKWIYAWLFLGGAVGIVALILVFWQKQITFKGLNRYEMATLVLGSWLGTLALYLGSSGTLVHYAYPAMLLSFLACWHWLWTSQEKFLPLLLLANSLMSCGLIITHLDRLILWPTLYRSISDKSEGTAFSGFPMHRITVFSKWLGVNCFDIAQDQTITQAHGDAIFNQWEKRLMNTVFSEKQPQFGNCSAPYLFYRVNAVPTEKSPSTTSCEENCPRGKKWFSACTMTNVQESSGYRGLVQQTLCVMN